MLRRKLLRSGTCYSIARERAADRPGTEEQHCSVTDAILSDPDIEGDPLKFLRVSEAYWQVLARIKSL